MKKNKRKNTNKKISHRVKKNKRTNNKNKSNTSSKISSINVVNDKEERSLNTKNISFSNNDNFGALKNIKSDKKILKSTNSGFNLINTTNKKNQEISNKKTQDTNVYITLPKVKNDIIKILFFFFISLLFIFLIKYFENDVLNYFSVI